MKKIILTLAAIFALVALQATPLWMRYNAISPDGTTIAFSYQGDIYLVPAVGGEARKLVATDAYEYMPVWSPDGNTLAYASDTHGNFDIFTIAIAGGNPVRLTTNSHNEAPLCFSSDGKQVYFNAYIQKPAESAQFPSSWIKEVYAVGLDAGRPVRIFTVPAMNASATGDIIYYEKATGSENNWRKHHVSSVARNIFKYDLKSGVHTQLTTNVGEDRNPVVGADGRIYFLSERNGGSFNVYAATPDEMDEPEAITSFTGHPVRFLSAAADGTLCYGYQGEIYTQKIGGLPSKVNITMRAEIDPDSVRRLAVTSPSEFDMTPDGSQIVFVARGDVFAFTNEYATTRQITHTAAAERGVSVHPDGRQIVFASERTGRWALYTASIVRDGEVNFANATLIEEKPLFDDEDEERFAPQFSPDGKEIAFIADRSRLMVYNIATKKVRQITDGSKYYDTNDYGFYYQWSPDCQWFVMEIITHVRAPYTDVAIVSAVSGGEIYNITNSAYIDGSPRWALDGNAIVYVSNRLGMRAHASWGSQDDVFIAYLNQDTYDKYRLSKEEYDLKKAEEARMKELAEKAGNDEGKKDKKAKKDKKSDVNDNTKNDAKKVFVDLAHLEDRIVRLTPMSSQLGSAVLSKDGEKLYFTSAFEKGYDLWQTSIRERDTKIINKNIGSVSLMLDKDGKNIYAFGRSCKKINVANNSADPLPYSAVMYVNVAAEREAMFNHVFVQQKKRFYNSNYHGVDLDRLREDYLPFLPYINNNYDFSELLSEILGELNVSHTGSGYFAPSVPDGDVTADFGLFYDQSYTGDGLKVSEILVYGPFDTDYSKMQAGCIVEKIDGVEIKAGQDYYPLLNRKAGEKVLVSVYNPETGLRWDEVVKPVAPGALSEALYRRWVKGRAEATERLSGGRLGYVHIRSMADGSYRQVYADILGRYNECDGIVIDTRYNGGGRLHEDIEILFSGEKYLEQTTQGRKSCDMPSRRYNKKSIMLVVEANYSNAHGTPWVYRHKGMGSIVGMPVPGTMTSVNWETLQDPTLYFGIPVIGYLTKEGYYLENTQLEPDILVDNDPESVVKGEDKQLEAAVRELLRQIDEDKTAW
ncbi:MAG: S41 family peptidase [Candidatus Aphodosoma sp.]